jgi:transposase
VKKEADNELPAIPPKPSGKPGKLAKSDAHNLLERLQVHEVSVLLFAKNLYVSFANNRAERDLRMSNVKQKAPGCFRKEIISCNCLFSGYLINTKYYALIPSYKTLHSIFCFVTYPLTA